ncbi:uncharacterized protein M421DRAFT_88763 [Didymella exigua CBS 183.55]|uniref:Uncharacterized protein n=1 Tax=Didymella exigua CBS 183.55 TaxID=1150837 RepID=A0A6A5S0D6_9PLEO|nr:uncharacterized protein M421DRAFT_88763 [Didymella exigua CBS 183.55]KAF1933582.1 hypothetical protein M421DRAFT_88763 [Didymella exigua CBS 183.55]
MPAESAMQEPASPPVPDVNKSLESPSPTLPPPKPTIDKPPSTPAAELDSSSTTTTPDATKNTPAMVNSATLHTSQSATAAKNDSTLADISDRPTILDSDNATDMDVTIEQGDVNATPVELQTPLKEGEENDSYINVSLTTADKIKATIIDEDCTPECTMTTSTTTKGLLDSMQEPTVAPGAGSCMEIEGCHEAAGEAHNSTIAEKAAISEDSEDHSFGDEEDTAVESQRHEPAAATPSRSVLPHMRPAFKVPNVQHSNALGARASRFDSLKLSYAKYSQPHCPAPVSRAPRGFYPPAGHLPSRPPLDYDELQRTKAQLMKACSDLEVGRKVHAETRKTFRDEKQASISAAMADMLSDLLQKQADALTAKARMQEKERDLEYREQKIMQLEIYLASGQKQLKWELEQQGIRTMSSIDEANLRREVELRMEHLLSNIGGKISIQVERLRHQDAAQKVREQQFESLIRDALENEIREQAARDMQVKVPDVKVTQGAYERGLAEGKKFGAAKSSKDELKQEFLKGYADCYRTLTVLHNVRNGSIAVGSPEVALLFDLTHPENPHNVGLDIGRMEVPSKRVEAAVGVVISRRSMEEGTRVAAVQGEPEASANVVSHRGHGQAFCNEANPSRSSQAVARLEQTPPAPTQEAQQTQDVQQEQAARSCVSPRPTFAGELRGSSSSGATSHGTSASRSNPRANSNASRAVTVGCIDEGVYAGRRTIRCEEDSEDEAPAPNLIDL